MTKGCYTCRRRRIICDNGLPTCRKCRDAGKECLGYQKPLVWVKGGVASRGKMMGRSFDDAISNPQNESTSVLPNNDLPTSEAVSTSNPNRTGPELTQETSDTARVRKQDKRVTTKRASASVSSFPAPRALVDPLFQDLSPLTRFYVSHFNQNLVGYLALYSHVNNPFRQLTPLVGESPVLAYALAATGALHYAILANCDFSPTPWSNGGTTLAETHLSPQDIEKAVVSSMCRRPTSKTYEHFLGFKQRTLNQLSRDLHDPSKRTDNRTLATIMILALMDAIESGDGAWKYHLEGAKQLLLSRGHENNPLAKPSITDSLDTFAIDGCLLIQLMGSTLARPGSLTKPFYSSDMGAGVLKRLEETSWVGCPAYLLEVIFIVHAGWCSDADSDSTTNHPTMNFPSAFLPEDSNPFQSPGALLRHIQAFDPVAWAQAMQTCLYLPDQTMRIALASVYRASVYLYASRVLSRPRAGAAISNSFGLPSDHSAVANRLIQEIVLIPVTDPHFKCLIWPSFIAGAECRDPAQRPILLQTLSTLYYHITSVNVRNAAWVLSLMWRKRDAKRQEQGYSSSPCSSSPSPTSTTLTSTPPDISGSCSSFSASTTNHDDDDFDWIQELDSSRIDWLFI
ncbi:putative C6 finger domain protein Acr-2 [Aspergillus steynii IBT 23096]|uniref:Putative C6 finger domain protein Acr-2 n=1 Tax=Aspergillus steynii IBT 23096 TaxID=1392250 RepID=A0A2I2GJT3_9EURO|nr:putative C6 finger domain protein Acr-2 [Aspergillus steynii IBT 23096]PLB53117.1 putative C6 finger domain protein Acr-2 [Aspergillus steynii IBT 23096]